MSIDITKLEAYGLWCRIENTCKLGYGFSKTYMIPKSIQ